MLPTVKRRNRIREQSEEELVESEGGGWEGCQRSTGCPIKCEFQINKEEFFSMFITVFFTFAFVILATVHKGLITPLQNGS